MTFQPFSPPLNWRDDKNDRVDKEVLLRFPKLESCVLSVSLVKYHSFIDGVSINYFVVHRVHFIWKESQPAACLWLDIWLMPSIFEKCASEFLDRHPPREKNRNHSPCLVMLLLTEVFQKIHLMATKCLHNAQGIIGFIICSFTNFQFCSGKIEKL